MQRARVDIGAKSPTELLSDCEITVLRLLAEGRINIEVAMALFISNKTVSTYPLTIASLSASPTSREIQTHGLVHRLRRPQPDRSGTRRKEISALTTSAKDTTGSRTRPPSTCSVAFMRDAA
ncbi:LuxR C-terminal-related transcriptional regulator [Niveibacterium sp. 24ML]|uniref:LuxR C-terminal-related transcriptional regulator n=1 Tax=Niveibacterium sp. 24ML TaxID=2985512 RepID=UPI003B637961